MFLKYKHSCPGIISQIEISSKTFAHYSVQHIVKCACNAAYLTSANRDYCISQYSKEKDNFEKYEQGIAISKACATTYKRLNFDSGNPCEAFYK